MEDESKWTDLESSWADDGLTQGHAYYTTSFDVSGSLATACTVADCFTCSGDDPTYTQTCYRYQECNDTGGDGVCEHMFSHKDAVTVYYISGEATTEADALTNASLILQGFELTGAMTLLGTFVSAATAMLML